jgi:virulence-associated protein VapD
VAVYNNNAYAKHLKDKTGKFPHQQFLKVALDMNIAKVKLSNVDISYSEYDATSKQTGKITFNNTRGTIYNVTNTKEDLAKNSVMVAKLKTNILNLAPLDLTFKFFMNSKIGAFSYNGVLGAFDGKIANQIVRPLGMAEIKSAKIEKLAFQVQANQNIARGKMQFIYKNLKVNVLKRDENGKLKKQGFISKLANLFIINDANPDKRGKFIEGVINYERPKTVSFFSFLWKSLFTGIKQSVGVSSAKESKIKNSTIAIQNVVSDFKTTIAIIKENRKEHKRNRKIKKLAKLKEESKDTTIGRTKQ